MKYTDDFKKAIMSKPKTAALIKSKPGHQQEVMLQRLFDHYMTSSLVNMTRATKLEATNSI
jgi:hypothetical protein